ncbi:Drug/metabolite transporter [Macleaya cordata]|uniref:Drug/metabolite transporter n=1 Tax=Macleaya cordata TaxID=56857 RepID=A0A200PY93_MACCD|nr:Drug/metabolite transporter [Macleaya cordata]
MSPEIWRWGLGLIYIFAVATIWIAASFVVQSVVDSGVSPFLITYICNSLFVVYIPIFEISRYLEDSVGNFWFWGVKKNASSSLQNLGESEEVVLLGEANSITIVEPDGSKLSVSVAHEETTQNLGFEFYNSERALPGEASMPALSGIANVLDVANGQLDAKGRWTRNRMAKVSLLICPFWFLAQLTFNLSLKYTTVTSNTILSSASSLFTFLVALLFLGEKFTWVKLVSVLLCMGGTIIVSLGDSESGLSAIAPKPLLGDLLALVSAGFYAVYITLIRKKLPDDDDGKSGQASMAQFLGYLGLFNLLLFLPIALLLNFAKLEPFHALSWKQFGLIVGKGCLLDNVLSDYLWAKAVLLTTTTVATAGLTIQVPLAAIVDSLTGHAPHLMDYLGAAAVMVGFAGINIPSDACFNSRDANLERADENVIAVDDSNQNLPISRDMVALSLFRLSSKYAVHGLGSRAIEAFEQMLERRIEPNEDTFISILSSCRDCGLVDDRMQYFKLVKDKYGMVPGVIIMLVLLIYLLRRAGRLDEMWSLLKEIEEREGNDECYGMVDPLAVHCWVLVDDMGTWRWRGCGTKRIELEKGGEAKVVWCWRGRTEQYTHTPHE